MNTTTIIGLILGVSGIVLGHIIEGGHFGSLVQSTAAMIVFAGTIGATLVSNKKSDIQLALKLFKRSFFEEKDENRAIANEIVTCARVARKEGMLAVETRIKTFSNDYMKNVFRLMVDGVDPERLKEIFNLEIDQKERKQGRGAKVWTDAGGYAPTIGIIGAVLGLIHVMGNLTNTAELGKGIAVAFVATIYGVASANLLFLPIASKIKKVISAESEQKEMIVEGAYAILSGHNPYLVEERMRAFTDIPRKSEA